MRRLSLAQRREELVDAAIRVIARDGLAAATTRAIVAEADMPLGSFHYVFTSRDQLISAVIESVTDAERLAAWLHADVDQGAAEGEDAPDLEAMFRRGLEGYLALLEESPSGELALFEVALHSVRRDPEAVRVQWDTYRRASQESLEHAARLARVRWRVPVEELAHSLTRSVDGLTITWLADRDGDAARLHIRFLASSFAALAQPLREPVDPPTPTSDTEEERETDADRTR